MCAKSERSKPKSEKQDPSTAVCSFIGHREIYDTDLEFRLQIAVDHVVENHETVRFLIYPRDRFYYLCLLAALRAKSRCPQKVTVVFVIDEESEKSIEIPACFYDEAIVLRFSPAKRNHAVLQRKKVLRWLVQKSTHLISYKYDKLYDADCSIPKGSASLNVINLTSPETEKAIFEAVSFMTERGQIVFEKRCEGCTLKETGKTLGIGPERVRQILYYDCRIIRRRLFLRRQRILAAEHKPKGHTCGLFALDEDKDGVLCRFKSVFNFLVSAYKVDRVYVEDSSVHASLILVLTCLYRELHVEGRNTGKTLREDVGKTDYPAELCPFGSAVGYTAHAGSKNEADAFPMILRILEQTDFCVCDLSDVQCAERIRKCAQEKGTVLLDLSSYGEAGKHSEWAEDRDE